MLVPVGALSRSDLFPVVEQVARIYEQAGVSLATQVSAPLLIAGLDWGEVLDDQTSPLANYSSQMRQVIRAFKEQQDTEAETAYVFLLALAKSSQDKRGYMPKKRPYGFVFSGPHHGRNEELAKTIAPELGHGLFRLEHTFQTYPALTRGSTNNLMDYDELGTQLQKYQWDYVHNPQAMLGWFQDEEDNASYDCPRWFSKDDDCESVGEVLRMTRKASENKSELITYGSTWKKELVASDIEVNGVRFAKIKIINMVNEGDKVSYFTRDYQDFKQSYLNAEGKIETLEGFILQTASSVSSSGKLIPSIPAVKILLYEEPDIFEERKNLLEAYLFGGEDSKAATLKVIDTEDEKTGKREEKTSEEKIEAVLTHATTATEVGSRFTKATACNICVRAALYLIKGDSALFPLDGSGYHDPNNDYISREIKGYITPNGNAKRIKGDFDNLLGKPKLNERFVEVKKADDESWPEYFKRLQDEADVGGILIGVMLNSSGTSGHVMMVMPGGLVKIDENTPEWGKYFVMRKIDKVPRVLECGGDNRSTQAPLCTRVDRKGAQERLKWFRYTQ